MDTEKNTQLKQDVQDYIDLINRERKHLICGMMVPQMADCDPQALTLTLSYSLQLWEQNPNGVLHGGVIATMLDTTMGILTHVITGELTPTISMSTSFLRPAPGSGTVFVKARILRMGRTIIYAGAEVWEASRPEKLIATAEATYRNMAE